MSAATLSADGREVEISRPDKLMWPEAGITKRDLAEHWLRVADTALPHLRGRPLTMERAPDGIDGDRFIQKHAPDHFPDWMRRVELDAEEGVVRHLVVGSAADLLVLADQACLALHVGLARVDRPRRPDRLAFDLDPSDDDFAKVREAARLTGELLRSRGATPFVQTTGSQGLHVVTPLDRSAGFEDALSTARSLAERLVEARPELLTTEARKADRGDRVLLDVQRNAHGQTMVAPYSPRTLPGAPAATPVDEAEMRSSRLSPDRWSLSSLRRRLGQKADPWAGIDAAAVPLSRLDAD